MTQPLPDPAPALTDASEQARLQERLKQAEQQLDHVMAGTDNLVVSTDGLGRIVSWNPRAEKLLGFSAAEVIGHPFVELITYNHRHSAYFAVGRALAQAQPCTENWAMLSQDGQVMFLVWKCIPFCAVGNQVSGLVCIGKDLSIPENLEWGMPPPSGPSVSSMHQTLIHELRNQLTICASYTQLLLGSKEEVQDQRHCLERIYASLERASATIDNLEGLSRE